MNLERKYIKYPKMECVMPFMFTNDVWTLIFNELLKNEKNPIKHIYGSVYCAWQSGRHAKVYEDDLYILEKYLQKVSSLGLITNFTFSTLNVDNEKLNDKFSNDLLDLAYKYNSYFIVSSDKLYAHIKQRYNNAKMVCSVIVPSHLYQEYNFNETEFYNKMLDKYELIVIRPEYTIENIGKLDKLISDISRIEVLINQNCFYNCPNHKKHYSIQEKSDLLMNKAKKENNYLKIEENIMEFCPHYTLPEEKFRSVRMNVEIVEQLLNIGVKKFKFQGRDGRVENLFNDFYEFLFNNEISKEEIKRKVDSISADLLQNNRALQFLYLLN